MDAQRYLKQILKTREVTPKIIFPLDCSIEQKGKREQQITSLGAQAAFYRLPYKGVESPVSPSELAN